MLSTTASIQRFLESLQYCTCIVRLQCTTCFGGSPSSNANKMYFNAFQCTVVVNCTMLRQGESICLLADLKFSSREYGLNTMWRDDLCHVARKIWNPWLYFYAFRSFHWINVSRRIIAQLSNDKHISAHLSEFNTLSSGLYSTTAHGTAVPPGPTFHYSGFFRKLRINKKVRLEKIALNLQSIIIWSWLSKCVKRINASRLLPSPCVKVWKEYMKEE